MQLTASMWRRLQSLSSARFRRRIVVVLLGFGLVVSGLSARSVADLEQARHTELVEAASTIVASRVEHLTTDAVNTLASVRPLWLRRDPSARDFARHVQAGPADRAGQAAPPNGTDIAFIRALDPGEAHRFARGMRSEHPRRYRFDATPGRPHYIVDFHTSNSRLGADLYPLDDRRDALERARDRATAVVSPWYTADDPRQPPSARPRREAMIVLPVYDGAARPTTTEARRAHLIGWLATPLDADTVVEQVVADLPVRVELRADGAATPIATAGPATAGRTTPLTTDVLGRPWSLGVGVDHVAMAHPTLGAPTVLAAGLCLTVLLTALVWLALRLGARSQVRASAAAARVRERDEHLRVIADRVPVGIADLDPSGRIRWANAQLGSMAGLADERLTDLPYNALVLPEDRDLVAATHDRAFATGEAFHVRHRLSRGTGERWVEQAGAPTLDDDGKRSRVVVVISDVSALVDLERQLHEARERAVEASRRKSAFLAAISREIRLTLDGVIGTVDVLPRAELATVQRSKVAALRSTVEQLHELLGDVRDLSEIEAGHLELDEAEFDVADAVTGLVDTVAPAASSRGLRVHAAVDGLPARVRGPYVRLRQVLGNLLRTSLRSTGEGEVRVAATVADRGGDHVRLRFDVIDTGSGISDLTIETIFDPFVQSAATGARPSDLGLALSRRLVEMMGGLLEVETTAGQGNRFTFTVSFDVVEPAAGHRVTPTTAAAVEDAAAADRDATEHRQTEGDRRGIADAAARIDERRPAGQPRLLVVEDNPINQEVARELLGTMGYRVDVVNDGAAGVAAARDARYAAILMDCQMPVMDGYEATARIRAQEAHNGRATPIIALTASTMAGDRQRCLAAGMDDYVSKPVDAAVLRDTLARWIGTRSSDARTGALTDAGVATEPPVIDWQILDRLSVVPGLLERTRATYLANGADEVVQLRALFAAGDRDALRAAAHKLKGASLTVGAMRLGDQLHQLERDVGEVPDVVDAVLVTIEHSFAEVRAALLTSDPREAPSRDR